MTSSTTKKPSPADDDQAAFGHSRAVVLRWQVPENVKPTRADVYLTQKIQRLSRSRAQKVVQRGDFRSAGGPFKASSKVCASMRVELWRFPPDEKRDGADGPSVLYEDNNLLVLNKPGDLAIHPSAKYLFQTVTAWLQERAKSLGPDQALAHPCHRLDRETSGVLVCASDKNVERAVKMAFADGKVSKQYLAVVHGQMLSSAKLTYPLALQGARGLVRIRMIEDADGLPSVTDVTPLAYDDITQRTLVLAEPRTGRQHQIRAHLALAGHPLVGDKLYYLGDEFFDAYSRGDIDALDSRLECPRHALHAYQVSWKADDGTDRRFRAPFPGQLAALLPGVADRAVLDALCAEN